MSEDNLEPLVTQCPNCDTRFRVSESQLQIAAGRVRCGACLAVFEGTAHLLLDGEEMVSDKAPADVDALLILGQALAVDDRLDGALGAFRRILAFDDKPGALAWLQSN